MIRGYVTDLIDELDPDEKLNPEETIDSLLNDYEWLGKIFLEFQVLIGDTDTEIKNLRSEKKIIRRRSNPKPANTGEM